jgi:hypothetical protein
MQIFFSPVFLKFAASIGLQQARLFLAKIALAKKSRHTRISEN